MRNQIIITSPCLDESLNVSGISTITKFIIKNNKSHVYSHFKLGKTDDQKRGLKWLLGTLWSFFVWCRMLIANKNVVIHFNHALEKPSIIRDFPFIVAARLLRRKMVIHLHGGIYLVSDPPKWLRKISTLILTTKTPKIVLSASEKDILSKKFNIDNVFILPNSINTDEAKTFDRVYSGNKPLNLLFMGRIVRSKGIEYIYEACVLLQKREIKFNLFLAGKGTEQDLYISKFSSLLKENFIFKGVVSGKEKNSLMQKCDIFLLPSVSGEGLPIALIESMSFGLVPITTSDGSMQHLVKNKETGIIVTKYSGEEIAGSIAQLNGDRTALEVLGRNAKKHILQNYNPNNYIQNLNLIYNAAT